MPRQNVFVLPAQDLKKLKRLGFGLNIDSCPSGWSRSVVDKRNPPVDESGYRLGVLEHHYKKGDTLKFVYFIEYTYYDGSYSGIECK